MKLLIWAYAILLLILTSCESESDASAVVIQLKNWTNNLTVNPGEIVRINIKSFTINESIRNFKISSFDNEYGNITLFETEPDSKEFTHQYFYTIPSFRTDSINVELKFQAADNLGNLQEITTNIIVKGGKILSERSGIRLYAGNSGREDGFSLNNPSQVFITSLVDDNQIDVYAYDEGNSNDALSREWRTKTDIEFVKNNAFDYSNATAATVSSIYSSSRRSLNVKDIRNGDIIILGKGIKAWGVFLIVATYDNEETCEDGYLFNYKAID